MTVGRWKFLAVATLGGVVGAACTPWIPPLAPNVDVSVVDDAGAPVVGATVRAADKTGKVVAFVTDANGAVDLPASPRFAATTADAPGMLSQTRLSGGGEFVLSQDSTPDDDGDGLSTAEEERAGTDPAVADTDSDGLADGLEAEVIGDFAPIVFGASPLHRDMFVEVDWSVPGANEYINPITRASLADIFGDSSIENPDGTKGVVVHVDAGERGGGSLVEATTPPGACLPDFTPSDHVAAERQDIFFHALIATLDCARGYAYARRSVVIDADMVANGLTNFSRGYVLAHELGHTLGLLHGGFENTNCKPNYPSVMNYDAGPLFVSNNYPAFSRGEQPPIDERSIKEFEGFYGSATYDFNHNGVIEQEPYAMDLTDGQWINPVLGWLIGQFGNGTCYSDGIAASVHEDHDDWATIEQNLPVVVGDVVGQGPWFPGARTEVVVN